ncbi:MAG: hypothetical protein K9H16_06920 [Bacteroidales bacterium]|nr:hypothetical protein [Bacteroidales bacterium]
MIFFAGKVFLLLLLISLSSGIMANNIQISNVTTSGRNTTDGYTVVLFNLTWENSWLTSSAPNNRDAARVFVKYRMGTVDWQRVWLNDDGHTGTVDRSVSCDATMYLKVFAIEMVYVPKGRFYESAGANPAKDYNFTQANNKSGTVKINVTNPEIYFKSTFAVQSIDFIKHQINT